MFKIGDFSRFGRVSVETLRHYHKIGLLKPVRIDKCTGYRYYSAGQFPRLNTILTLKSLGLTLDEISSLVNDGLAPDEVRAVLAARKSDLQEHIAGEQSRLVQLEKLLERLEREGTMPQNQIIVKKLEPQKIISVRKTLPDINDMKSLAEGLKYVFKKHPGAVNGPLFVLYHETEWKEKDVDVEICLPLADDIPAIAPAVLSELPGVETAVSTVHHGSNDTLYESYQALLAWCETNHYELNGPDREIYLSGPGVPGDSPDQVKELQLDVKKTA